MMETQDFLPESDQDLQLAKQLNAVFESKGDISTVQDPLIQSLSVFRQKELNNIAALEDTTSDIWSMIDQKIKPSHRSNITQLPDRKINVRIWATAATVLIAAFIGILWFTNLEQPKLVAKSGNTIEFVTLEDGSRISLRPNSSLFEIALSETKRSYKIEGEGFFEVSKDADRPFSVQANNGTITVLGTQFNVSTWGNETLVFLEEGSVRLDDDKNNSLILIPGEKAVISDSDISKAIAANIDESKDWLNNEIIVNSTPLTQVVAELEHHYGITVSLAQADNESELISGTIPLSDMRTTFNDLGIILGGTFREVNSDSFVFIPLN